MKRQLSRFLLAVAALALHPALSGRAADVGPYFRLDGGASFVEGTGLEIDGLPGHLSLDTGFRVDGIFGYRLNRWLGVEFEGGFQDNSVSSLSLEGQTAHPGSDSHLYQIPLLANVVFRYENSTAFIPYVGAGAGGVLSRLKIYGDDDQTAVFALQAKAGLIYKIMEDAWVDVGYKFLGTAEQGYNIGGSNLKTKEVYSHFLGASVVWNF